MVKRLCLIAGLLLVVSAMPGCRLGAPILEDMGGCPYSCHGTSCDTKTRAILREWGRDARHQERFIDTYFLNYDINDPYRGDCVVGW